MLSRFRKVKNRVFWQENKPEEGIETDLNWIWQPFETSSNLEISVAVKKIVSAIIESSPDDIPKIPLKLDPRLVIPLCAIQLQDEINLTRLRSFNEELESILLETNFEVQGIFLVPEISPFLMPWSAQPPFPVQETFDIREEFSNRVVSQIEPTERWQYLFKSLTPELQFSLLSRLIKYRSPRPNDWRNIYEEIEYKFQNSWEYWVILIVVFLLSLGAVLEIFTIMISQPEKWLNSLMIMAIVVVLYFLIVLWEETQLELDSNLLIKLGLLGFLTFGEEWLQLLRKNRIGEGVTALFRTVAVAGVVAEAEAEVLVWAVTRIVAGVMFMVGAWAWTKAVVWAVFVVEAWAVAVVVAVMVAMAVFMAVFVARAWAEMVAESVVMMVAVVGTVARAGARAGARIVAVTVTVVGTVAVVVAGAGSVAGAVVVAVVLGWALGIWYQAKGKSDLGWIRFFSILAFPWFCWLPIVVGFMSFALYDRFSWEWWQICLSWLGIFGFCTVLWVRGKKLEEKALNPLKGILG